MDDYCEMSEPAKFFQNKITLEDGIVKFNLMISLKNIAMLKVISNLWMDKSIQKEMWYIFHKDPKMYELSLIKKDIGIENRVANEVSELSLPGALIKKLTFLVPILGKCIFEWIKYHDKYVFFSTEDSKYFAVDFINNIAWTVRGKIDYVQTAKSILANQTSGLSKDDKYKLACSYCLENEIAALASNVVSISYLNDEVRDLNPMIYLWTASVTGDGYKLHGTTDSSIYLAGIIDNYIMYTNEHIVKSLIFNNNETISSFVPIRYMWNKLKEEEKARNINALVQKLSNQYQDFRYTLLSNLDFDQQQEVFKESSAAILISILNDWLFSEYFLSFALYVLDIMSPSDYEHVMRRVSSLIKKEREEKNKYLYEEYKSVFKTLWQKGSTHIDSFFILKVNPGRMFINLITNDLSWEQDLDVIDVIFNDLNGAQKKNLMFESLEHCLNLIEDGRWDLLQLFINYTLSSEEDIKKLKEELLRHKSYIILCFLKLAAFDKADDFMNWASLSEDDIRKLKHELITKNLNRVILRNVEEACQNFSDYPTLESVVGMRSCKGPVIKTTVRQILLDFLEQEAFDKLENCLHWALESEEAIDSFRLSFTSDNINRTTLKSLIAFFKNSGFAELENRLQWCAKGDTKVISHLKTEVFNSFCKKLASENIVKKFINGGHCELLEKILNWCFLDNEKNIVKFKNMYKYNNLVSSIRLLIFHLIKFGKSVEMLDKFLSRYFTNEEETQEFKTWLLYPLEDSNNICIALLCENEFKLAQKFTYWCCISFEAERNFKNTLMLSNCHMEIILNSTNEYANDNFQSLIKWLNPSKETLDIFFGQVSENNCSNYFKFHDAVKEFVVKRSRLHSFAV